MNLKTPHAKRVWQQPKGTQWSLLFFAGLFFFLIFRLFVPRCAFLKERQNPYNNQTVPMDVTIDLPAVETNATNLYQWPSTVDHSLTAILPVNFDSLSMLEDLLRPLLKPSRNLREIMILCPDNLILQVRGALRNTVSSSADHPDISLHAFVGGLDHQTGVVNAVSRVSTDWVLLMDHQGLLRQSDSTTHILLHPSGIPTPTGPRGVSISASNVSCIITLDGSEKASYLLPPFLMPSFFATNELPSSGLDVWASLGTHISNSNSDRIGGVVIKSGDHTAEWCPIPTHAAFNLLGPLRWKSLPFNDSRPDPCLADPLSNDSGVFAFFIPTIRDLQPLGPLMCLLQSSGHRVNLFVYRDADGRSNAVVWEGRTHMSGECSLSYSILSGYSTLSTAFQVHLVALDWLSTLDERPDIIVGPSHEDFLDSVSIAKHQGLLETVVVRIPKEDFPYCMWMGSLSITEWRGWKIPHVDISIITKDRPKSLSRLLRSLSNGRFFGDSADIRINLEQSADMETMKLVEGFSWPRGSVFTHHRVIHGGLLPAVVESWYPGSNDTYGLLLEDDVELSPLFYAWVKMSILRYRYGDPGNRSPRLFGISLYQQKNVELPLEGRRVFNARTLFTANGLPDATTPYLSPVPCSWGAVYFPEHWREFHTYLSFRLSEHSMKISEVIVPGVRSNKWTKSWKKYFIELVYLRGYVMLYPNYEDFISFSTNHLEVGSHVKVRTKEKRDLFVLPLMQLSRSDSPPIPSLLDLPSSTLPKWDALPVLNLTGSLTTLDILANAGTLRRTELTGCIHDPMHYNVQELMCISSKSL